MHAEFRPGGLASRPEDIRTRVLDGDVHGARPGELPRAQLARRRPARGEVGRAAGRRGKRLPGGPHDEGRGRRDAGLSNFVTEYER